MVGCVSQPSCSFLKTHLFPSGYRQQLQRDVLPSCIYTDMGHQREQNWLMRLVQKWSELDKNWTPWEKWILLWPSCRRENLDKMVSTILRRWTAKTEEVCSRCWLENVADCLIADQRILTRESSPNKHMEKINWRWKMGGAALIGGLWPIFILHSCILLIHPPNPHHNINSTLENSEQKLC